MAAKSRKKAPPFQEMDLSDAMKKALERATYETPTPIQAAVIPLALQGKDILGQARTGTGKTAAFAVPILENLKMGRGRDLQALVLVPTRELAVQVHDEFKKLAYGRGISNVAVYGGKPIRGQIEKLRRGAHIVVGTPGRVIDHLGRGTMKLDDLRFVVLDEADRMLDIGFRPDIEKILRRCPTERQTMLLSATVPPPIQRLAQRYMKEFESLDFSTGDVTVSTIDQYYFTVDNDRKFDLLLHLLARDKPMQAIIFCRTRRGTDRVHRRLSKRIKRAGYIHGDMSQRERDRAMRQFRDGDIRFLVATDVVGRGIDVTRISHIVNFDSPTFCDDYVHRVGRTGRMGREGVAYTFVTPEEGSELTRIEQRINRQLIRDEIPGFQLVAEKSPEVERSSEPPPQPPPSARSRTRRHRRAL